MSEKSHGGVKTSLIHFEQSARHQNVLCNARLGIVWNNYLRADEESGEILNKEYWTLNCECTYPLEQSDYY